MIVYNTIKYSKLENGFTAFKLFFFWSFQWMISLEVVFRLPFETNILPEVSTSGWQWKVDG